MSAHVAKTASSPCPTRFNMAGYVLAAGEATPDKIALEILYPDHVVSWTFAELRRAILGLSRALRARATPGDRVILRLGNGSETPICYLAAIAANLVPVPLSPQLTEGEVADVVELLRPALILHDPALACPQHAGLIPVGDLDTMMRSPPAAPILGDPNRLAYIVFTSGTSGKPRAVMHAHRSIWARRMMFDGWYGLRAEDRMLHAGAFNWTFTMGTGLMDPWSVGATALIPAPDTRPEALLGLADRHKATLFAAAPGVYRKLCRDDQNHDLRHLRHGLSAGEKLSPSLRATWEKITGKPIFEAFGMSECSTFISGSPDRPVSAGALGYAQIGRRVEIIGPDGQPVAPGAPGIIAIHKADPGLMLGYWQADTETAAKIKGDWFLTGDLGQMGETGEITYLGRADDMMNAGGYRVSPLEVEAGLAGAPGIDRIVVTDVEVKPDVRIIIGFYTAPTPVDHAGLRAYAAHRLAAYKRPRDYVYVTEFPTGPNGKLSRKALKSLWRGA